MRPYTQPNFYKSIETLRAEVMRDYEQMFRSLKLPKRLDFPHACKAVLAGGLGVKDGSAYETFRNELLQVIASTAENKYELQDVLEILTGVWNHFPHNDLNGLAPIEKMRAEPATLNTAPGQLFSGDVKEYGTEIDCLVMGFAEATAGNLLYYLKDVGLGKKEQQHILNILSDPQQDPEASLSYLFNRLVAIAKTRKRSITIEDVQPLVRALTWCENYTPSKMPNGHWNSRMFQNVVEQAMEFNTSSLVEKNESGGPDMETISMMDPLRIWHALSMIHDAISDFCETLDSDIGIEEATRHLVDWLALTDIHELLIREDLNLTALHCIGAARLIAVTGNPKQPYKRLETSLRKEIVSQVEPAVFDSEIKRIAEKALNAAQDPIMLMPYPGKEPDNCLELLAKLAPDLKLRSHAYDDLSPVPSPFFPFNEK